MDFFFVSDPIGLEKRNEDTGRDIARTRLKNQRCDNISSLNVNKSSGRVRTPFKREIHFHTTITEDPVALRDGLLRLSKSYSYSENLFLYDLLP